MQIKTQRLKIRTLQNSDLNDVLIFIKMKKHVNIYYIIHGMKKIKMKSLKKNYQNKVLKKILL